MTDDTFLPGDRVFYQGPLQDCWGHIGVVRKLIKGGEVGVQFKWRELLVHACPTELVLVADH